jgi:hypothetical protein
VGLTALHEVQVSYGQQYHNIAGLGKSTERATNGLGKKMRTKLLSQLNRYGSDLSPAISKNTCDARPVRCLASLLPYRATSAKSTMTKKFATLKVDDKSGVFDSKVCPSDNYFS